MDSLTTKITANSNDVSLVSSSHKLVQVFLKPMIGCTDILFLQFFLLLRTKYTTRIVFPLISKVIFLSQNQRHNHPLHKLQISKLFFVYATFLNTNGQHNQ